LATDTSIIAIPKSPVINDGSAIAPTLSAAEVGGIPILKHIADAGAQISDVGSSHGLEIVLARQRSQFMMFEVSPDGEAVVAGLPTDLSVSQLLRFAGTQVTELGTIHGLRGLFLRNGQDFQVLYATPDGERLIPGVMWDASGKDITRKQVRLIAGTVPTVVVGADVPAPGQDRAPTPSLPVSLLAAVKNSSFGIYGDTAAPRLWMFIDPQCPFSIRAMQLLQPLVDARKVQLAVIPLSVIDYENQGQSTKSALAMLSKPAEDMVAAWRGGQLTGQPGPTASMNLRRNMEAAEAVGVRGTPTFVWQKPDGSEARSDGLPPNLNALVASLGG
jgi:thiol:disulfide interchange protein DsbG